MKTNSWTPRHHGERTAHLKQRPHNQNTLNRKQKGQLLSQKLAKRLFKIKKKTYKKKKKNKQNKKKKKKKKKKKHTRLYKPRHSATEIANHIRSTALEHLGRKSILCGHNSRPYFCLGKHDVCLVRVKDS